MKNMFQGLILSLLVSLATACNPHASYCDRNEMALKEASEKGNINAMERLYRRGVDIDAHCEQEGHLPAIVLAAHHGELKAVQSLIAKGANVNEQIKCEYDSDVWFLCGSTALLVAARKGYKEVVNALLRAGALVNEEDEYGDTPLMRAARGGHPNIALQLIHHGADVNKRDHGGDTALSLARERNSGKTRKELVRILKEGGATEDCPRSCLNYAPCIIRGIGNGISCLLSL